MTEKGDGHERYGYCRTCHLAVHEYPVGVRHLAVPFTAPHEPQARWICCDDHKRATR